MRNARGSFLPKWRLTFALLAALALVATGVLAAPAEAAFPGANGKIAFTSDRDGSNFNIFKMSASGDANGTIAPTQLTTNFGHDGFPAWSPDGSKIAFSTDQDGNNEIYTMNADGTNQTDRTLNPASD